MSDATTEATPSTPAAAVTLSGTVIRVAAGEVGVSRLARTHATDMGPVTAAIADLPEPRLTRPTDILPGALDLGAGLPAARVTPGCTEAAEALVALLADLRDGAGAEAITDALDDARGVFSPAPDQPGGESGTAGGRAVDPVAEPAAAPPVQFVALDVETANERWGSVCQVGLAVVRAGAVAERHSWLCRPPEGLDEFAEANIAIHGIRPGDVDDAPAFADLMPRLAEVIGDAPVVAHNARFDFSALHEACAAAGVTAPGIDFACTYRWARLAPNVHPANFRLPTLAKEAGVIFTDHHDACADAVACAEVALWLMRGDPAHAAEATTDVAAYTDSLGLRMGRLGEDRVTQVRFQAGRGTGGGFRGLYGGGYPAGGEGDSGAGKRGVGQGGPRPTWDRAKTPDTIPEPNTDANPDGLLFGQNVTLTGDFAPYDKGELWERMAEAGATIGKNVTKKTTLLVVGPWDSVTSKEKKAREYRDKGQDIQIWDEKQLFTVLGL